MQRHFLVLNGPNLNLLGSRQPEVYGSSTLEDVETLCRAEGERIGATVATHQSNHEGALIDHIHQAMGTADAVVLNAGAFTHTSYALHDAILGSQLPTVEVHISNILEREPWRRTSLIAPACSYSIYGRGVRGYADAIRFLGARLDADPPIEHIQVNEHASYSLRRATSGSPTVALIHGGFWRHQWTADLMEELAADLAAGGATVANLEFRRTGAGGAWPTTVDDVTASLQHLQSGGADDLVVVGHSAGGHLAAVASARLPSPPSRVVTLGGVLDLELALSEGTGGDAVSAFLAGADPADASPARLPAADSELVILHGADDDRVPPSQARAMQTHHPAAQVRILDGVGHFEWIDPQSDPWREARAAILGE